MALHLCDKLKVNYEVRGPDDLTLCSEPIVGVTFPKIFDVSTGGMILLVVTQI